MSSKACIEDMQEHMEDYRTFQIFDGFLNRPTLHLESLSLDQAKARCATIADCVGFSFEGQVGAHPMTMFFKNKWELHGQGSGTNWTSCRMTENHRPVQLMIGQCAPSPPFSTISEAVRYL